MGTHHNNRGSLLNSATTTAEIEELLLRVSYDINLLRVKLPANHALQQQIEQIAELVTEVFETERRTPDKLGKRS